MSEIETTEAPTSSPPSLEPASTEATPQPEGNLLSEGATIAQEAQDWKTSIEKDYLGNQTIANAKDPNDLARQIVNLEKVIGKPKVSLPEEGWGEPEYNEFFNKLGRPESKDGYEFNFQSDKVSFSKEDTQSLQESFYKAGLTQQQAQQVFESIGKREESLASSVEDKFVQTEASARDMLEKEWGGDFENNLRLAAATLDNLVDTETAEIVKQKYGNDPHLAKMLAEAGRKMMDDSEFKGTLQSSSWTSPVSAQAEIGQLKADPSFMGALMDKSNPGHGAALDKWTKLHNTAYQ